MSIQDDHYKCKKLLHFSYPIQSVDNDFLSHSDVSLLTLFALAKSMCAKLVITGILTSTLQTIRQNYAHIFN